MKYGLELPNGGPCGDAHTLADLARLAEDAGWDGMFLEDHAIHHNALTLPRTIPGSLWPSWPCTRRTFGSAPW